MDLLDIPREEAIEIVEEYLCFFSEKDAESFLNVTWSFVTIETDKVLSILKKLQG